MAFCKVSRIARQVVGEKLPSYRFIGPIANSLRLIRSHKEIGWFPLQVGLCGENVGKKLPSYMVQAFCEVSRIARQVVGEKLPSYRFIGPIANSLRLIRSHMETG